MAFAGLGSSLSLKFIVLTRRGGFGWGYSIYLEFPAQGLEVLADFAGAGVLVTALGKVHRKPDVFVCRDVGVVISKGWCC